MGKPPAIEPHWSIFLSATQSKPTVTKVVPLSYRQAVLAQCGTLPQCITDRWPAVVSSDFFNAPLPIEGIVAMFEGMSRVSSQGIILLDLMRGAISRVAPDHTAFVHRNALFSAFYALTVPSAVMPTWQNEMRTAMKPWSSGAYVNYTDPLLQDWATAYYKENYTRLTHIKAKYDPTQVFNFPQGVKPS